MIVTLHKDRSHSSHCLAAMCGPLPVGCWAGSLGCATGSHRGTPHLHSCTLCPPPPWLQMFTTTGQASRTSIVKEIVIGAGLGTALGFWWQT